jgi:FkbM family methyltransferase
VATQAIADPRAAWFAVRERGLVHVLRHLYRLDPSSISTMTRDLRARSRPATIENLQAALSDMSFERTDDAALYKVRLPSGEAFFIRRARGWNDAGTLHDTFVKGIYANHPPLEGKTVLDIGANIGDTAVYFAKRGARVTAYEPDPQMCDLARANARLNGCDVAVVDAGIGGTTETMRLTAAAGGADSVSRTLFPGYAPSNRLHVTTKPVRIIALADALAEFESVDLVKFDCEGCEYPALLSLPLGALRKIGHIVMEFHDDDTALSERLGSAGFAVRVDAPYLYADRESR